VRIAALEALETTPGAAAAVPLAHLSRDENADVAAAALTALGRMADADLDPLLEALRSADPSRRHAAVRALVAHAGPGAVPPLEWTAAADADPAVARTALDGLSRIAARHDDGADAAVEALLALLADQRHREAAVVALGALPSVRIHAIGKGLEHPMPAVRRSTLDALARLRHPESSRLIESALGDTAADVREAAVIALARLGSLGADGTLSTLARQDPSKAVRRAAAAALSRVRPAVRRHGALE
jgi:HEAT repeat protein